MTEVAIVGVGMTRFTKQAERGHKALLEQAVLAALDHAGLQTLDVSAVFCGSVSGGSGVGQKSLKDLALGGAPITNVENACASSSSALREAYAWIKAGLCDVALACGVEIMSVAPKGPLQLPRGNWIFDTGLTLPMWYALRARRHMTDHGTTPAELASVAVKSRRLAALNPLAHFRSESSIDAVLRSPMIADPLTLHQCCPKTDGASAAVVVDGALARRRGLRPTWIRASALGSGTHVFTDTPAPVDTPARVARKALEDAGVEPGDLDVVEVHDAFSIGEVIYTEALGICGRGEGARYASSGRSMPGANGVAVNTSGGLLSRGHPLGASGLAQIAEVVWQLRGEAGPRQVSGARLGAVHTMGANEFELDGNACSVFVLEAGR